MLSTYAILPHFCPPTEAAGPHGLDAEAVGSDRRVPNPKDRVRIGLGQTLMIGLGPHPKDRV